MLKYVIFRLSSFLTHFWNYREQILLEHLTEMIRNKSFYFL